jgi:hypothetical protein
MNVFRWGNTRLMIGQVIEAGRHYLIYLDPQGVRRFRWRQTRR